MKINLNTRCLRTTLTVTVTVYYFAIVCAVAVSSVFGANYDGQQLHTFRRQHQHHPRHEYRPVRPYLRSLKLSPTDAIYLRDSLQQNHESFHQHHHRGHQHRQHVHRRPQYLQHDHHHQLEDAYLKESAKDPKNLKNGMYHQGAVTYDLGLPHYEILNPHEQPEIITSDQPNYQQHLKQLQQTQNFTLEDFGVTVGTPTTSTETTTKATTAYESEQETTTTMEATATTASPKNLTILQQDIEKEVSRTKEKLQKISDQMKVKEDKSKIYTSHTKDREVNFVIIRKNDNLRKKMKPAPFKAITPKPQLEPEDKRVPEKSSVSHDLANAHNMYDQNEWEPVRPSYKSSHTDPQAAYAHVPTHTALAKYPIYHRYPAQQSPYSVPNLPESQHPMSLGALHRLYRSASFLTNAESDVESSESTFN